MEEKPSVSLHLKIFNIVQQMPVIAASGRHHVGFEFVKDDVVTEMVRHMLIEANILFFTSMVGVEQTPTQKLNKNGDTTTVWHIIATFEYTFLCLDTGEMLTRKWIGEAVDEMGSGLAKATTSALKTFFMKTFLIRTSKSAGNQNNSRQRQSGQQPASTPSTAPRSADTESKPSPVDTSPPASASSAVPRPHSPATLYKWLQEMAAGDKSPGGLVEEKAMKMVITRMGAKNMSDDLQKHLISKAFGVSSRKELTIHQANAMNRWLFSGEQNVVSEIDAMRQEMESEKNPAAAKPSVPPKPIVRGAAPAPGEGVDLNKHFEEAKVGA